MEERRSPSRLQARLHEIIFEAGERNGPPATLSRFYLVPFGFQKKFQKTQHVALIIYYKDLSVLHT